MICLYLMRRKRYVNHLIYELGRRAHAKSYVWVTTSAEYQKDFKIALYHYSETRSDMEARRILKDYEGYVMCDGYAVYDSISKRGKRVRKRYQ